MFSDSSPILTSKSGFDDRKVAAEIMKRIASAKPVFLRRLSTDEYDPAPYSGADERVVAATADLLSETDQRSGSQVRNYAEGRDNTAAGLLALNDEWGHFYHVSSEAVNDPDAASDAFDGPEVVIDVQTHFLAPHCQHALPENFLPDYYRPIMPAWWKDLEDPVAYDLGTWIDKVFLRTENAVAVLTSGPGLDDWRHLFDDEMASDARPHRRVGRNGTIAQPFGGTSQRGQRTRIDEHVEGTLRPGRMEGLHDWSNEYFR